MRSSEWVVDHQSRMTRRFEVGVVLLLFVSLGYTCYLWLEARGGQPTSLQRINLSISAAQAKAAASMGRPDADIVFVEFSDYQCPFCGEFSREVHPQIVRDFVDPGSVRYLYFDFPLEGIHPRARRASEVANCARSSGRYWLLHHAIFENQQAIESDTELFRIARSMGMDESSLHACMSSDTRSASITADQSLGRRLGVRSTPTFMAGRVRPDGSIDLRAMLAGAKPFSQLKEMLAATQ